MKIKNLKLTLMLTLTILGLVMMMALPASAHFDNSWDWHNVTVNGTSQYKTTVHYCLDPNIDDTWKGWIEQAVQNWNDAGTGWTIVTGPPCQITIKMDNIRFQSGGAYVSGFGGTDANNRISNLTMVFDSNLSDQLWGGNAPDGWGTSGNNTLDPVAVIMHELGHTLRMRHSGAGVDTGDLEDPVTPGNHNHNLSASDKSEAGNGTTTRGAVIRHGNMPTEGGDIRFGKTYILFPAWSVYESTVVSIRPLSHMSTPDPSNVPDGVDGIIIGVDTWSELPTQTLEVPATVTITYDDQDLAGAYFIGDLQITPAGAMDESSLKAFSYDRETAAWIELESTLDTDAKTVTFDTLELGFMGIGAAKLEEPPSSAVIGIVRDITHSESTGLSIVVVEDNNGVEHTLTIPYSTGKDLKVGDEIEVTMFAAGTEIVGDYNVGDMLAGTITNVENVVSVGEGSTTLVTVMGPGGVEYTISVPFVEGDLLTVGDEIEIPVTEIDDGELLGEGTMTSDGENITDVVEPSTEPTEIEGTVTSVRNSGGRSFITIAEQNGAEHEIEVSEAEAEKIKLGVNVRVKILKSADGNIESIDVAQTDKLPGFGALMALGLLSLVGILVKRKEE